MGLSNLNSNILKVHKVVLSAASKTLHDLALEFDMTPHRERDQLEIIIPPDVALFAVNMFINYIYTGMVWYKLYHTTYLLSSLFVDQAIN